MSINLLPEQAKKELRLAAVQKKVFAISVFIVIFFLLLMLIFLALSVFISSRAGFLRGLVLEREEELKAAQFQGFKNIIETTNQNLSKTQRLWQQEISITSFFEEITSLTPEAIYFKELSFKKIIQGSSAIAYVRISGFAPTREVLFSFREILEKDERFQNIYFPPSCWVNPTNIEFSLDFKYIPKQKGD